MNSRLAGGGDRLMNLQASGSRKQKWVSDILGGGNAFGQGSLAPYDEVAIDTDTGRFRYYRRVLVEVDVRGEPCPLTST